MSITVSDQERAYTPPRTPADPARADGPAPKGDATLNQAIATAQQALKNAQTAQDELDKATKARQDEPESKRLPGLQDTVDAKKAAADRSWDDAKVASKAALALGGQGRRDEVLEDLKTPENGQLTDQALKQIDQAGKEKADPAIIASGDAKTDAAAKRVAGAYADGGDQAAAKQLRTELEAIDEPKSQSALLRSAMPVLDRIAQDVGRNSRRPEGDWAESLRAPAAPASADLDNPNPIDTRKEFDHTVSDLEASLDLAGDSAVAGRVAQQLLRAMPGGEQGNGDRNLMGLLGRDLAQSSPDHSSLLEKALSDTLIQPTHDGVPAGSQLTLPLDQRDLAARYLTPDLVAKVVVEDWEAPPGLNHDGHVWHEVAQNPDLFLSADQRADIHQRTQGWPEAEVLKEKTTQAVNNLRAQAPGQNLDQTESGDVFTFVPPDDRAKVEPLAPEVQAAVDEAKAAHEGDLAYGMDLDALTRRDDFHQLSTDRQVDAVGQFDRTFTQAEKTGKALDETDKTQLRDLIASAGFHDVDKTVQERVLGLFSEFANANEHDRVDNLIDLAQNPGWQMLDNGARELEVLEGYQHDPAFAATVDKLTSQQKDLPPADQRTALDLLTRVKFNRQLYEKADSGEQARIMESVYQAVTDPRFRGFAQNQKDEAINQLVKYGDEEYALEDGGVQKALEAAEQKARIDALNQPAPSLPTSGKPVTLPTPATTRTVPQQGHALPPTAASIKADLQQAEAGAKDAATSKATINDELRRVAGDDPVTYAYLKLQRDHQDDKAYTDLLTQTLPAHRLEQTTLQVKEKFESQTAEALKLLRTQMDAAANPAERKALWDSAGAPVFTQAHFDQKIDSILNDDPFNTSEELAGLLAQVGENGPPEAANLLLDAVTTRLDRGTDNPLSQALLSDASNQGQAYGKLSALVETADSLGRNRADEMAQAYVRIFDEAGADPQHNPDMLFLNNGNAGLYKTAREAITEDGDAKLSVALYNAAKQHARDNPAASNELDWASHVSGNVRNSVRDGVSEFRKKATEEVEDWQDQNQNALRLVQDFGNTNPQKVAETLVNDRKANPEDYYRIEKDKAVGIDVAQRTMEERGVKLDGLMRDLTGLQLDPESNAPNKGEERLAEEIQSLDSDEVVMNTLNNNVSLETKRENQLNFGEFDASASPFNPTAVVGGQRDYLDKLVRDYHLPDAMNLKLNERTNQWEKDLQTELAKGNKASEAQLSKLTTDYEQDLHTLLRDTLPPGQDQVLVKPAAETVTEIRNAIQITGTFTSLSRLSLNWYKASGNALLSAYSQVTVRRGLNAPDAYQPNSALVGNVAHLGFTDKQSVKDAFDYMKKWQSEVKAATANGPLNAAEKEALYKKLNDLAPPLNTKTATTTTASIDGMRTAERITRGLAALCFTGSAINNAASSLKDEGTMSSEVFTALYAVGGTTELLRAARGANIEGGSLQNTIDWLDEKFGKQLAKAGPNATEDLAKFIKKEGLGAAISLVDLEWAYEDFNGKTFFGDTPTGTNPDATAGWLTSGVVLGDALDFTSTALRTQVGAHVLRMALSESAFLAVEGSLPVVGWVAAGITAAFLGARFAYGVTRDKNKFEYDDNEGYAEMVKSMGFSEEQARELMNENGGSRDKAEGWRRLTIPWDATDSFFTEGGMSPMHVLNPLFDTNGVPQEQRLQYLQSLTPEEIQTLVKETHSVLDHEMQDDGTITAKSTDDLAQWMKDNELWKEIYLGKAQG